MKNTREAASTDGKLGAVASVLISYLALIFVQSAASRIFTFLGISDGISGAACGFLSYLSGIMLSALVYKYAVGLASGRKDEAVHGAVESGRNAEDYIHTKASEVRTQSIFYTLGALTLMLLANICFAYFSDSSDSSAHSSLIFSAAIGILIKSPLEETLFRGAYLKLLSGTLGALPSVLLVSILFGAWHPTGSRIFATVSGVILGALYLGVRKITYSGKSDCALICTSLCHALFNAVMYAAELADTYFNCSVFGTICAGLGLSALIFAVSAAVLIVKNHRHAVR